MENNLDDMSLFNNDNIELNIDYNYDNEELQDEVIEPTSEKDELKPIDEELDDSTQESVDGEDDDNSGGDESNQSSPNIWSSNAAFLQEQGLLPSLKSSNTIKSAEDLAEAFKKELEIQADFKAKTMLDNLDLEKIAISKKSQLELESITEDYLKNNPEIAKDIIFRDYLNQGLSEERARKMLRKTIDLGEEVILEDALESVQSLKEFEKRQNDAELENYRKREAEAAKELEKINQSIKNCIYNSKEVISGIPNTKALQDKVFKSMTEPVAKNPETGEMMNKFISDRMKNPIEFDVKIYYLYELTNGFTELGNIKKTTVSKVTKQLEDTLRKTKFEDSGVPAYLTDPESYGGIGSELVF